VCVLFIDGGVGGGGKGFWSWPLSKFVLWGVIDGVYFFVCVCVFV
jgi:hypothetical protein